MRQAVEAGGQASERGRAGLSEALRLTVSAGVASAEAPIDGQALLAEADHALFAERRAARPRSRELRAGGPDEVAPRAVSATA